MDDTTLTSFVESVCGESHLRVEHDFGGGFVRLRSTEAEKRQAAQDIRSTEDIVIELLRNARDAGACNIFLAAQREEEKRTLVIIDDGMGIPPDMQQRIFEPRVTSKLDSARMDKWGMHGRGMALYSVSVNAESASVACSDVGRGASLSVATNLKKLGEKTDQSSFPRFEVQNGVHAMRGPRNIMRTAAEFALEHRKECNVFCGSMTEIAATLYAFGCASLSPAARAFGGDDPALPFVKLLCTASDPADFTKKAALLGLVLSERSARRILDGSLAPVPSLLERLQTESLPAKSPTVRKASQSQGVMRDQRGLKLDPDDADGLKKAVSNAFRDLAKRYYLEEDVPIDVRVAADGIRITIPVEKLS